MIDLLEEPDVVTLDNGDEGKASHSNRPEMITPRGTTSAASGKTIDEAILREAIINSIDVLFTKKKVVTNNEAELEIPRQVTYSGAEQSWLDLTDEKKNLCKRKRLYAVKRTRHEPFVTDLFHDKDVKPPKRKTHNSGEKKGDITAYRR